VKTTEIQVTATDGDDTLSVRVQRIEVDGLTRWRGAFSLLTQRDGRRPVEKAGGHCTDPDRDRVAAFLAEGMLRCGLTSNATVEALAP
jgi:hypothetical protein